MRVTFLAVAFRRRWSLLLNYRARRVMSTTVAWAGLCGRCNYEGGRPTFPVKAGRAESNDGHLFSCLSIETCLQCHLPRLLRDLILRYESGHSMSSTAAFRSSGGRPCSAAATLSSIGGASSRVPRCEAGMLLSAGYLVHSGRRYRDEYLPPRSLR